jgi:hypothetical protein
LTIAGYLKRAPSASYEIGKKIANVLQKAGVPS